MSGERNIWQLGKTTDGRIAYQSPLGVVFQRYSGNLLCWVAVYASEDSQAKEIGNKYLFVATAKKAVEAYAKERA